MIIFCVCVCVFVCFVAMISIFVIRWGYLCYLYFVFWFLLYTNACKHYLTTDMCNILFWWTRVCWAPFQRVVVSYWNAHSSWTAWYIWAQILHIYLLLNTMAFLLRLILICRCFPVWIKNISYITIMLIMRLAKPLGEGHFVHSLVGYVIWSRVSKGAKIRNRYNQVPHLTTQDTYGKVTNSQLDTRNTSQENSPFPAGDHKAHINRRAQRHSKHKTEQKHKRLTKEVPLWNGQ